jgi:hypothetical protein
MRNPMNSWNKSYSYFTKDGLEPLAFGNDGEETFVSDEGAITCIGKSDRELMLKLAKSGSTHAKYRRMIVVYLDIVAPLYWWKEFDTYKIGTVANSCSTMHRIQEKEFTLDDFSHEHIISDWFDGNVEAFVEFDNGIQKTFISPKDVFDTVIDALNASRNAFLQSGDKKFWWQMIQLLPSSYNQRRTVMLNYEVLAGLYPERKNHKLDEWHVFCDWVKALPFSTLITLEDEHEG